jgi:hypothetical protein
MSMNFNFSRGYAEYQAGDSLGACCHSNTNSAEVLLEQQWQAPGGLDHMPDDTGGL